MLMESLTRSLSPSGEGLKDKDNSIAECGIKKKGSRGSSASSVESL